MSPTTKVVAAALVLVTGITAAAAGDSGLPPTPEGTLVAGLVAALNADDPAVLERFAAERWSPDAPRRMSPAERAATLRRVRVDAGVLSVHRIEKLSPDEAVVLLAGTSGGFVRPGLALEAGPAPRVRSARIELVDPEEAARPPLAPMTTAQAQAAIKEAVSEVAAQGFSGSVLVARRDRLLLREAHGLASREHGVANRPDTKFNLGSINKLFTRVAIARLAAAGALSLDDTLGKWLPEYSNSEARGKVTLRHLVAMSSGIGDFFGERFDATPKDRLRSNRDYLPLFAANPLLFEAGTSRRYSNGGYVVLGEVIAAAARRDYYDHVRSEIFARAGMTATDAYEADAVVPNLAEGYTRGERADGPWRSNIYTRPARGSAAGGGYSTVDDLLVFTRALLADTLLPAEWTEWILGGPEPAAGAASAEVKHTRGGLGVAGGAPGINAALELECATGDVVIVLANLDPPAAERLAARLRRILAAATLAG